MKLLRELLTEGFWVPKNNKDALNDLHDYVDDVRHEDFKSMDDKKEVHKRIDAAKAKLAPAYLKLAKSYLADAEDEEDAVESRHEAADDILNKAKIFKGIEWDD